MAQVNTTDLGLYPGSSLGRQLLCEQSHRCRQLLLLHLPHARGLLRLLEGVPSLGYLLDGPQRLTDGERGRVLGRVCERVLNCLPLPEKKGEEQSYTKGWYSPIMSIIVCVHMAFSIVW